MQFILPVHFTLVHTWTQVGLVTQMNVMKEQPAGDRQSDERPLDGFYTIYLSILNMMVQSLVASEKYLSF